MLLLSFDWLIRIGNPLRSIKRTYTCFFKYVIINVMFLSSCLDDDHSLCHVNYENSLFRLIHRLWLKINREKKKLREKCWEREARKVSLGFSFFFYPQAFTSRTTN